MAIHERPDDGKRALETYCCDSTQKGMVSKCVKLLQNFPFLKVWETQYPSQRDYTCFYVSFRHNETPWILNFTMYRSYTNVEFRYPQYLPSTYVDELNWITGNWAYIRLITETTNKVKDMLSVYTKNIREDFDKGKLKQGGKSFAEKMVADLIKSAFPNHPVMRNVRPNWLKSDKGNYLELDILIPEMNLAIEIQGPQHFTKVYGDEEQHLNLKNDLLKKGKCMQKGLRLMWISVENINRYLLKVPYQEKITIIRNLITNFADGDKHFLFWKNATECYCE